MKRSGGKLLLVAAGVAASLCLLRPVASAEAVAGGMPPVLRGCLETGRVAEAVKYLREQSEAGEHRLAEWFEGIVVEAWKLGKLAEVRSAVSAWKKRAPQQLTPALLEGDLLALTGDWEKALAAYQTAQRLAPDSPEPLRRMAQVHVRRGDYLIARKELEAALRKEPEYWPAIWDQVRLLTVSGRSGDVRAGMFDGRSEGGDARGAALRGESVLMDEERESEAREAYEEALKQDAASAEALFGLAALAERANAPDACDRWRQFLNAEPYGLRAEAVRRGVALIGLWPLGGDKKRAYDVWPAWSPDGRWVVYSHGYPRTLWLREVCGEGRVRQLTSGEGDDREADWSPLGDRLLFKREKGEEPGLYTVSPFSGEPPTRIVAQSAKIRVREACWHPDGRRVLFRRTRDGLCLGDADAGEVQVLGSLKTGQLLMHARFAADEASLLACAYPDPNGAGLTSESHLDLALIPDAFAPRPALRPLLTPSAHNRWPMPSPDGLRFAFGSTHYHHRRPDLWIADYPDAEWPACVVPSLRQWEPGLFRPAWSPDGRRLAFSRDRRLWLATLGGLPAIPVHLGVEWAAKEVKLTLRSFADEPLNLTLFHKWYDDQSRLVHDNWDSPGEAADLAARGTQQVVLPVPRTDEPPVTVKVFVFDVEGRCVVRMFSEGGEQSWTQ